MGQCANCSSFFPPEFIINSDKEPEALVCLFCNTGKDSVNIRNKSGLTEKYYKSQCIAEYKLFLKELKHMPGVAKALAKKKVSFIPKKI